MQRQPRPGKGGISLPSLLLAIRLDHRPVETVERTLVPLCRGISMMGRGQLLGPPHGPEPLAHRAPPSGSRLS